MSDNPQKKLFEPIPIPPRRTARQVERASDDNLTPVEYELNEAIAEAEADRKNRPERANLGYSALKRR